MKWGGAVVTVLLVVVWIGSRWWFAFAQGTHFGVTVYPGGIMLVEQTSPSLPPWWGLHSREGYGGFEGMWEWWFGFVSGNYGWQFFMPLWPFALATLSATVVAWRLDTLARRRARLTPHLCPKCNYDRTGLAADAVCPECGAASS